MSQSIDFKDISLLSQKSTLSGNEMIPVSDTQYVTTSQIASLGGGGGGGGGGTVTSVGMTVPTGLSVSGSPITSSGTLAVSLASGYEIPQSSSVVHTTGNETIGGTKTFTNNISVVDASNILYSGSSSYSSLADELAAINTSIGDIETLLAAI